jgi:hypothetical protein
MHCGLISFVAISRVKLQSEGHEQLSLKSSERQLIVGLLDFQNQSQQGLE